MTEAARNEDALELAVVYADDAIVVVDKPSGLLSVPGRGPEKSDCIVSRVRARYPGCIPHPEVHRLDMDTSGLMVLARTTDAHRSLSRQFRRRETRKYYVALLDGELDVASMGDRGTIELAFRMDLENRPVQIHDSEHGKLGVTHWEVLSVSSGVTRVSFAPVTGRTHQLRVHAAHPLGLGIPIVGDPLYGNGSRGGEMLLHARELGVRHPTSGEMKVFRSSPRF